MRRDKVWDEKFSNFLLSMGHEQLREWLEFALENFDEYEDDLHPLDTEKKSDLEVEEYEEEKRKELEDWVESHADGMDVEVDWSQVMSDLEAALRDRWDTVDGESRFAFVLPNWPWNDNLSVDFEAMMLESYAGLLGQLREEGAEGFVIFVANRNSVTVAELDGTKYEVDHSQGYINASKSVVNGWGIISCVVHNFFFAKG